MLIMIARAALVVLIAHWGSIGSMALMGFPIDSAVDYTFVLALALLLSGLVILGVLFKQGDASEKLARVYRLYLRYSPPAIAAAIVSSAGAIALYVHGERSAALCALGLGTVVVVCDTAAIVRSLLSRPS